MTTSKLQEAIGCIKSGDRQNGQRLLTEVLQADPRNETAWLWMSALMSGEKRRFCLEKVLSINPNHSQAREQLARLTASPPQAAALPVAPRVPVVHPVQAAISSAVMEAPVSPPSPSSPAPIQPAPEPMRRASSTLSPDLQKPRVWLIPGKTTTDVIFLSADVLLTFAVLPDKGPAALEEISQGVTVKQLDPLKKKYSLFSLKYAPLARIKSVTALGDSVNVAWTDSSGNEKKISCNTNKEISQQLLDALRERLPGFQESAKPISRLRVMLSSFGFLAFVCVATSFFWWVVNGAQQELEAGGTVRLRGIAALLMLIGPNGILCIGGALALFGVFATILSLSNPPVETILTRGRRAEAKS